MWNMPQKGAKTIRVTSYRNVPIEDVSDIVLYAIDVEGSGTGRCTVSDGPADCLYMLTALQIGERLTGVQETYEALANLECSQGMAGQDEAPRERLGRSKQYGNN